MYRTRTSGQTYLCEKKKCIIFIECWRSSVSVSENKWISVTFFAFSLFRSRPLALSLAIVFARNLNIFLFLAKRTNEPMFTYINFFFFRSFRSKNLEHFHGTVSLIASTRKRKPHTKPNSHEYLNSVAKERCPQNFVCFAQRSNKMLAVNVRTVMPWHNSAMVHYDKSVSVSPFQYMESWKRRSRCKSQC